MILLYYISYAMRKHMQKN